MPLRIHAHALRLCQLLQSPYSKTGAYLPTTLVMSDQEILTFQPSPSSKRKRNMPVMSALSVKKHYKCNAESISTVSPALRRRPGHNWSTMKTWYSPRVSTSGVEGTLRYQCTSAMQPPSAPTSRGAQLHRNRGSVLWYIFVRRAL